MIVHISDKCHFTKLIKTESLGYETMYMNQPFFAKQFLVFKIKLEFNLILQCVMQEHTASSVVGCVVIVLVTVFVTTSMGLALNVVQLGTISTWILLVTKVLFTK